MDIAYELLVWLERMGFGTIGTDLFPGQIPNDKNGLWSENASGQPEKYVPIEKPVVDLYCKDTSALDCVTKLNNIKRAIHRMHNTTINSAYVYSFLVIGDIEDVQRDLEYAKIKKITIQVMHRDTNVIS